MPTIFDNIETNFLESDHGLINALSLAVRGDFCVGYFNLRGWRCVDDIVEKWEKPADDAQPPPCRLLVGMQRLPEEQLREWLSADPQRAPDNKQLAKLRREAAREFRKQLTVGCPSNADEKGLRRLAVQLREERLCVKLFLRHPLHAKLYLAHRVDPINPIIAYLGSSNLTLAGLKSQGELNIDVLDRPAADTLHAWFNARWEDPRCLDISMELIDILDESWAGDHLVPPYHVYLKMAWHLSQDARDGIKEFRVPADIRGELLDFQAKAVQIACRHVNRRGGVLVGDVVGLGKTRIASAIARVLSDDQMLETLILCPKNLTAMWEDYVHRFKLRAAKVMSQSVALKQLDNLPRYRLVLIDESHNFRNSKGKTYQAIRHYIDRNDCKVILLSATPYNKTYLDLGAQLRLFLNEQDDLGIRPETYLRKVGESAFSLKNPNTPLTSLAAFEQSDLPDDWRDLMRLFLVRRTRSFIIKNYAETDNSNGRAFLTLNNGQRMYFPDRVPVSVGFPSDPDNPSDPCARLFRESVVDTINSLHLPRYGRSLYLQDVLPSGLDVIEKAILEDLSRAGKRMKGFCRTNLFKRLESSAHAFLLSLHRHILRNYVELHALKKGLPLPIGQQDAALLYTRINDTADGELDLDGNPIIINYPPIGHWDEDNYQDAAANIYATMTGEQVNRYRWLRHDVFDTTFADDLREDARALLSILTATGEIPVDKDYKLQTLIKLLRDQHPDDKFLLFTQFADTATYLATALEDAGLASIDCATGNSDNPAAQAWRFSPVSNDKLGQFPPSKQTRVLIATDVLSEGQNLQDAARVINYDLPWAIIRLIQRAGRVDRIGQLNPQIHCYSFLPADGVEDIIKLRRRLADRLRQNEEVVGSDEAFFEDQTLADEQAIRNLYDEKSGILDEPEDDEVDLTSEAYEVWAQAIKNNDSLRKTVESLPDVIFATKKHVPDPARPDLTPPGVLTYISTPHDHDALMWLDAAGNTVTESLLRIFRQAKSEPAEPALPRRDDHHELVCRAVDIVQKERRELGSGRLGAPRGARYRTYNRLNACVQNRAGDLFMNAEIRAAITAIYNHPLTTEAVDKLNRQLRSDINDDTLATIVGQLHRDDRLVHINAREPSSGEPRILCSIGLTP